MLIYIHVNHTTLSNMLPAGYFPKISRCDLHENALLPQVVRYWDTTTMVPLCFTVALGSLFLHLKHTMVKRDSNMEKNTINLGSL